LSNYKGWQIAVEYNYNQLQKSIEEALFRILLKGLKVKYLEGYL